MSPLRVSPSETGADTIECWPDVLCTLPTVGSYVKFFRVAWNSVVFGALFEQYRCQLSSQGAFAPAMSGSCSFLLQLCISATRLIRGVLPSASIGARYAVFS